MKVNLNNRNNYIKGITMISLVITIIVLMILAGVSMASLTGDNGLLKKTGDAKQKTEEVAAFERIEVEVLSCYNRDGTLNVDLINKKFRNINNLTYKDNEISETNKIEKLPVTITLDGYNIDIDEYGNVSEPPDYEKLESLYGKVVQNYSGYSATDVTEWKLFYIDEENKDAFIISSNTLPAPQPTQRGIPLVSSKGDEYTGSASVASSEYGRNYNGVWLSKCIEENTNDNAKATAFLCDSSNWGQYKSGKAKYAAGGPTMEIFLASYNDNQVKDLNIEEQVTTKGYPGLQFIRNFDYTLKNELYNTDSRYWIASSVGDHTGREITVSSAGFNSNYTIGSNLVGIRPIVCLPASAIQINGEGENITLSYK